MKPRPSELRYRPGWLLAHARALRKETDAAHQRSLHRRAVSDLARERAAQKRVTAHALRVRLLQEAHIPQAPRIGYTVRTTKDDTQGVMMVDSDPAASELIGEFPTADDANTFIESMRKLDAGPSHRR
jgi:hypothetical protein